MKQLLITIAAVVLVGCGESVPEISIHRAAYEGDIKSVKQHLAAGTDVNARNKSRSTALHRAAYHGHKEVAELLITEGADVNARDNNGRTALDWAGRTWPSGGNHPEIADLLRKHGAKTSEELKAEAK